MVNSETIATNQMPETAQQKIKLQQKKTRLIMEAVKFKIKERKMRTRHLIQVGGLVVKAALDDLATNSLFGALVSLKSELTKCPDIQNHWTKIGRDIFNQEEKIITAVILKFASKPNERVRTYIRQYGLK